TPFNKDRAYVEVEDIVRVKDGMKERGKTPSRAIKLHAKIYEKNPHIKAILVAHPMHLMAFAITGAKLDPRTIPESYILLRDVKRVPYEMLYTDYQAIADSFSPQSPTLLIDNDSIITTGESLLQAFDRLEVAEATAASLYISQSVGEVVHIKDEEIVAINKAFKLE
ncbi:MAG: class II aldolase/adducin family protein, partial [Sphaerochaetaceae bacterium]